MQRWDNERPIGPIGPISPIRTTPETLALPKTVPDPRRAPPDDYERSR